MRILAFALIASLMAAALAAPHQVPFSKTLIKNAHNEFRSLSDSGLRPLVWSTTMETAALKLAKTCNPSKITKPNNVLATLLPQTGSFSPKYHNDFALSIIEDGSEFICPNLLLQSSLHSFGCAVERCPKLRKAVKGFDPLLAKDKWDAIVCMYQTNFKGSCATTVKGPGVTLKKGSSRRVLFNKHTLTKLQNEYRHARSPKLHPIAWDSKLEKAAYLRAMTCNPSLKSAPKEAILVITDVKINKYNNLNLKLNVEDAIESCPGAILVPKLRKFGCAGVLCGPRPKAHLAKLWQNFVCEYDQKIPNACFSDL